MIHTIQRSTSLEPDDEPLGDQRVFDVLCDQLVDTWLNDEERQDLFDNQLPTMVDYALALKSLKPTRGLHFSLQQQSQSCHRPFLFLDLLLYVLRSLYKPLFTSFFFLFLLRFTLKHPSMHSFLMVILFIRCCYQIATSFLFEGARRGVTVDCRRITDGL